MAAVAEFDYSSFANQAQQLMQLVNKAHDYQAGHELEIHAFRAELDGDDERYATLRGRITSDTSEALALLMSLFLKALLRRNQALATACLRGVEALAAEADEDDEGGGEFAQS